MFTDEIIGRDMRLNIIDYKEGSDEISKVKENQLRDYVSADPRKRYATLGATVS